MRVFACSVDVTAVIIISTVGVKVVVVVSIIGAFYVFGLSLAHAKHQEEDHHAEKYPLKQGLWAEWLLDGLIS